MRALAGLIVRGIPSSTLWRLCSQLSGSTPGGIVLGGGGYASLVGARGAGQCGFGQISSWTGGGGSWCGVAAAWGGSAGVAGLCGRWARVGLCTVVGCARGWLSGVVTRWPLLITVRGQVWVCGVIAECVV